MLKKIIIEKDEADDKIEILKRQLTEQGRVEKLQFCVSRIDEKTEEISSKLPPDLGLDWRNKISILLSIFIIIGIIINGIYTYLSFPNMLIWVVAKAFYLLLPIVPMAFHICTLKSDHTGKIAFVITIISSLVEVIVSIILKTNITNFIIVLFIALIPLFTSLIIALFNKTGVRNEQ